MEKAEMMLRSKAIFNGIDPEPFAGYVAIKNNQILSVGRSGGESLIGSETQVFDLEDQLICPGFTDVHCFFTGYLLTVAGCDLSGCGQADEVLGQARAYRQTLKSDAVLLGREVKPGIAGLTMARLDQEFPDIPVVLFETDREYCHMNSLAVQRFEFTPDQCWSEKCWKLLAVLLQDQEFSVPQFQAYLAMMNARGITAVKEMGFDDFYGFTESLHNLEQNGQLTARVHFMSQPVGAPLNLAYGQMMRSRFSGAFVRFSGYNQMTDGSISQMEGAMKHPYQNSDLCCSKEIDWEQLKKDTLAADQQDFRFSLHAQGDGAISRVLDIFEQCQRNPDGTLKNRHAITDLECSDPKDLERMGQLGVIAEIYPQIMSLADRQGKTTMIDQMIGRERGKNYWNRRKMADSNVMISCGTDLPLLYDDIPESIYHSVGGFFPEGGDPFNQENTLTTAELLTAWCYGGQYNLGQEQQLGTLETGKLADLTVLSGNPFETPLAAIRDLSVSLTIVDGKIVYQK